MIFVCPQCDGEDISRAGGYLLCAGCSYAFPTNADDEVAARSAEIHNARDYTVRRRRRVGRPKKGAA